MSNDKRPTGRSNAAKMIGGIFGIIMIIVFIGMGVLLFIGFFNPIFGPGWQWLRWVGGVIFILYGIFRGYRQFKGIDTLVDSNDED